MCCDLDNPQKYLQRNGISIAKKWESQISPFVMLMFSKLSPEPKMSHSVYLFFNGCCGEAIDHYKRVFGAAEVCRQLFSDGPPGTFAGQPAGRIMLTTIKIGESILMGSDRVSNCDEPVGQGSPVATSFRPASEEEADRLMSRLAEGGTITMPLQ